MESNKFFKTRWGFILASVGSAVGMANVWGFPYRLGTKGGGSFLLVYLMFVWLFSFVGLPAEFVAGRKARTGPIGTYKEIYAKRNPKLKTMGSLLGIVPLFASLSIAIGYAVIVAYVAKALMDSLNGSLLTANTQLWFESFAYTPYSVIPYHIIVVLLTILTISLGAKSIEKTNRIMMPSFFIIFLILAIRVAFLPNAIQGYRFIFTISLDAFKDPMMYLFAMGQAFFSLSITGGNMVVYGAYLSDQEDAIHMSKMIALFDTIAAMVATLVIIPACFSYNVDLASGPGLLFVTLPGILKDIPFGQLFAIILYVAMILAGISSLQNMFEAVKEAMLYVFKKMNASLAIAIITTIVLFFGIKMEGIYQWGPWMDIVSIYIIPLGATIGAITWFYIAPKQWIVDAVSKGNSNTNINQWYAIGIYLYVPLAVLLCIIAVTMKISF